MSKFIGKRLLVLGGAIQHCKLVEIAKELGIITYVVDYLGVEDSPAKKLADFHYEYNVTDIDVLVELCKKEKIDGVITTHLDPCQRPYQQICEKLGFPCFGTREQFRVLTDKKAFKECCKKYGLDVIPEYKEEDFISEEICDKRVVFPVYIKPCDSRGSRGQAICNSYAEAVEALLVAKENSLCNKAVIEKYMGDKNDVCITVLAMNGNYYFERMSDRHLGSIEDKMQANGVACFCPSKYADFYYSDIMGKVVRMFKELGIKNAPTFMQGFVDGDTIRFYDPALRFPGTEYERTFKKIWGFDVIQAYVEFALSGEMSQIWEEKMHIGKTYALQGKKQCALKIMVKPGVINEIIGWEDLLENKNIVYISKMHKIGDCIGEYYDTRQWFGVVDLLCESNYELRRNIDWVYDKLSILDENGNEMIFAKVQDSYWEENIC